MTALGQKQTSRSEIAMSALPQKADIRRRACHVRFGSKADIQATFEYDYTQKGAQVRGAS
jgi:hypothetical protein